MAEPVVNFLIRGGLILAGIWAGLIFAAGNALLWQSWKRRKWKARPDVVVVECPYCDGLGVISLGDSWTECPLCDGESALAELGLPE